MSHSLQLGFASLPEAVDAAVVLLGDQPTVPVGHLRALLAARGGRPLVATRQAGLLGPPVLVERSHFSLAAEAVGDSGLRSLLRGHPDLVTAIDGGDAFPDIDDPGDVARLPRRPA